MNKPFWKSKMNWASALTFLAGFLVDPNFTSLIDPAWAALFLKVSGGISFVLSQWFTKRAD